MKTKLAPILLFAYNRLDTLIEVVDSLLKNKESEHSELIVFIDGPKDSQNFRIQNEIRDHIESKRCFFKRVTIQLSNRNHGLKESIINGINRTFETHEKVIILEDDIVVSEKFLDFMNTCLDYYKNNNSIGAISGYQYPIENDNKSVGFSTMFSCWGWATWKNKWETFEQPYPSSFSKLSLKQKRTFIVSLNFNYLDQIILNKKGLLNTWFIHWYLYNFLNKRNCIYPPYSLTQNIGVNENGTNAEKDLFHIYNRDLRNIPIAIGDKLTFIPLKRYRKFFRTLGGSTAGTYLATFVRLIKLALK